MERSRGFVVTGEGRDEQGRAGAEAEDHPQAAEPVRRQASRHEVAVDRAEGQHAHR